MPTPSPESTPGSPLAAARSAIGRGDFAEARRLARAALAAGPADEERREAEDIVNQTSSDKAVYWLLAACTIFLVLACLRFAGQ